MPAVRLSVLLQDLPVDVFGPAGAEDMVITDITDDSRRVRPGSLFLAMPGTQTDGARFVADAGARGAVAALVSGVRREWSGGHPALLVARSDVRRAAAMLSARFYGEPATHLDLVGVTGTNGKTTVVTLIRQLLEPDVPLAYWTTSEVDTGRRRFRPVLTTPAPPVLHRFLADAVATGKRLAVMEVSSHGVVLGRLYGLDFRVGVVTNVSPDHLDFHGSFDAYVAAKRAFAESLRPPGHLWLNGDDPIVREFRPGTRVPVYRFGLGPTNDLSAEIRGSSRAGTRVRVRIGPRIGVRVRRGTTMCWSLPLPGLHNVMNALAAFGAAMCLGARPEALRSRIERAALPPRRLETVTVDGYTVINDVAMNLASFDAVLGVVRDARYANVVVVAALRGNRGEAVNGQIAQSLAAWNRRLQFAPLILSLSSGAVAGDLADHRPRPAEVQAFRDGAESGGLAVEVYPELEEAIQAALRRLDKPGALLLLGTFGMDGGPALALSGLSRRLGVDLAVPSYDRPAPGE